MRIAFVDPIPDGYQIASVYTQPLGGSQSALCYLAEALAQRGHEVYLFSNTSEIVTSRGVVCFPLTVWSVSLVQALHLNAVVLLNTASSGPTIKSTLESNTQFVFWTGHHTDQPGVRYFSEPSKQDDFDHFVMVSDWQREQYQQCFKIPNNKFKVLKNAIAPGFEDAFLPSEQILSYKTQPPILAYTSSPYRGLDWLIDIFPEIRQQIPGTCLKVFSSFQTARILKEDAAGQSEYLYQQCQSISGLDVVGSLPQPELAKSLKSVTLWAYPSHFLETSCIAAMEAMASGCLMVTSQLGGLTDTTAGFAQLIPLEPFQENHYKQQFIQATVETLQTFLQGGEALEQRLREQVNYASQHYTWAVRAREWEAWLAEICTSPEIEFVAAVDWQQQARRYQQQGDYPAAIALYEERIAAEPEQVSYYWHWGVLLILAGRDEEAQLTWSMILSEADPELAQQWLGELVSVLGQEAEVLEAKESWQLAWVLRYYLQEFAPNNLENLLGLIQCSIRLENLAEHEVFLAQAISLLSADDALELNHLTQTLQALLEFYPTLPLTLEFAQSCLQAAPQAQEVEDVIADSTLQLVQQASQDIRFPRKTVAAFLRLCRSFAPNEIGFLSHLIGFSPELGNYQEAIALSEYFLSLATELSDQVGGYYLYLRSLLMSGGEWQKTQAVSQQYWSLLETIVNQDIELDTDPAIQLVKTTSHFSDTDDDPARLHHLRQKIGQYSQIRIQKHYQAAYDFCQRSLSQRPKNPHKKLRIGYLSACLMRHSVGFLARWVFQYHDYERFDIYVYSLGRSQDSIQGFIANQATAFIDVSGINDPGEIAERICQDEIDILIDLDSITFGKTCVIMALKPAPIQVTWLGFDASGLPAIDYFLADPYVLPDSAPDYYTEKIWRLPETYIAVDGFESTVPTLRREDLEIPESAVIYYTSQGGLKRHPQTTRLQLEVLSQVENSYLLVKGLADESSVQELFLSMAAEVGVPQDRLRFLPYAPSPEAHRANMAIADVVLDTYPYNGATTTLETLWVGIPLVTRVGEQFAARNSYTFLINAGISEGIAWTDQEYVDWGVRLGQDSPLRQQIAGQLRLSRRYSPLWNARKFTLELEKSFGQMWAVYP